MIPAAGRGTRMGGAFSKQYLKLEGRPLLAYSLDTFLALSPCQLVVVVPPGDEELVRERVLTGITGNSSGIRLVPGGDTRQDSVYRGVISLPSHIHYICVHDGARPLVTHHTIAAVLEACRESGAAFACVPLKDTIKEMDGGGFGIRTPARDRYVQVQTPQIFRRDILVEALERAREEGFTATDETALVERYGTRVKGVMGSYENVKVTTPEDLLLARTIMKGRGSRRDADRPGL